MTPDQIQGIRRALGESTETFGARFARSGRTVEDWEQGRRTPDAFVGEALARLSGRVVLPVVTGTRIRARRAT